MSSYSQEERFVDCAVSLYAETLPEFIAYHTVEKLCLPCKLVLPQSGGGGGGGGGGGPQVRRKPAGMRQALLSGAGVMLRASIVIYMYMYIKFINQVFLLHKYIYLIHSVLWALTLQY